MATRPSPTRFSTSSGLIVGAAITVWPCGRSTSTVRNQRPQCGGSLSAPSRPRVTGCLLALLRKARIEGLLVHLAGRAGGQHGRQRRQRDRILAGMFGTGGDQQRAAVFDILGDVVVVEDRQHAAMLVAVEDDQVEILDLVDEQLAGRKGDQRQFVDRRAVLLFRRAQNGEMDEIDRSVGLQQIAPGALAGMRLAGDEQHAQVLADAVDDVDGAIVGLRHFAGQPGDREFENVVAAARHREGEGRVLPGRRLQRGDLVAVEPDGDLGRYRRGSGRRRRRGRTSCCSSSTMPKRGALTTSMRRSNSSGLPVIRPWTGASKPSAWLMPGTSWIWPSVMKIAPPMRAGGTSASGGRQRVKSVVDGVSESSSSVDLDDARLDLREAARADPSAAPAHRRSS